MSKKLKTLVSIVLVTLMLMLVFVGAASAEESSGSRYYIDLGEMDLRGEGYYLSFALPAGYEVTDKAIKYVEYVDDIKGEVCAVYPGYAEIRIVGSSDAINHIYSSSVYVYFYHHACCDETGLDVTIDYDEAIEENCGDLARYHGPIKYTRIHGHDACYWENPGEDRDDMMHAHIFLEESHIYWVSSSTVGRHLFSSIQISGLPPTEEEPIEPPSTPIEVGTTPPETPTVIPSPDAAADFLKASKENKKEGGDENDDVTGGTEGGWNWGEALERASKGAILGFSGGYMSAQGVSVPITDGLSSASSIILGVAGGAIGLFLPPYGFQGFVIGTALGGAIGGAIGGFIEGGLGLGS